MSTTIRLFNIVSTRKGQAHPLHDLINTAGVGMLFAPATAVRESWMDDDTWREAQSLNHWTVTVHRARESAVNVKFTTRMQFGTYRVWKEGAAAAAPAALRENIKDTASVTFVGSTTEHREFIDAWSVAEPPCVEEVIETLVHDARNVEDNLTKKDFRRRFKGQTDEVCDNAWRECVHCRRHLRRLFTKSEYHTLLAWSYKVDGL